MKKKQFAVIGLGRFGSSVGRELVNLGCEVLGIDRREERVEEMRDVLTHVVVADCNDEEVLQSLGIRNFDCVIIAIGDDIQASILTAILLKELGVPKVVAKALTALHGKVLEKIGVDRIVYPERDMGIRVAHQLVSPNLLDYIELSRNYTIVEMNAPKKMAGRTIRQLDTRAKYGCSIVAIHRQQEVVIAPTADEVVRENDNLIVIGTNQQIEKFQQEMMR